MKELFEDVGSELTAMVTYDDSRWSMDRLEQIGWSRNWEVCTAVADGNAAVSE